VVRRDWEPLVKEGFLHLWAEVDAIQYIVKISSRHRYKFLALPIRLIFFLLVTVTCLELV
jgi:hypothetical protein